MLTLKINNTHKHTGFTVVELAVVIAIIGVLATLVSVAYAKVQTKSQEAAAHSDLSNLHEAIQTDVIRGVPLSFDAWSSALKDANIYDITRSVQTKTFVLCWNTTTKNTAIIAVRPLTEPTALVTGSKLLAYTSAGGSTTITYDSSAPGGAYSSRICSVALPGYTDANWSFNSP